MKIFVSYGHEDYPEIITKLVNDLSRNFTVWTDEKLHLGNVWHKEIDENISKCDVFLFIHAKYSIRKESYCWGEIEYAQKNNKPVCVLVLEDFEKMSSLLLQCQSLRIEQIVDYLGELDEQEYEIALKLIQKELKRTFEDKKTTHQSFFAQTLMNKKG